MSDEQDIEFLATICYGKTEESCLGKFDDFFEAKSDAILFLN